MKTELILDTMKGKLCIMDKRQTRFVLLDDKGYPNLKHVYEKTLTPEMQQEIINSEEHRNYTSAEFEFWINYNIDVTDDKKEIKITNIFEDEYLDLESQVKE